MWDQLVLNFGFRALWSPGFILFTLVLAGLYFWAIGPGRKKFTDSAPVPRYKQVLFVIGLIFFYLGYGGPLYIIGHLMFSAHMFQMAISLMIAPPLLLLGMPSWLLKTLVLKIPFKSLLKPFTKPLVAIILFNAMFSFYHFPIVFDYLLVHKPMHDFFQALIFIVALNMWWALVVPVPEWNQLSELKRIGLIFLDGILLTPACALIIFANKALYTTFSDPQTWAVALSLCLPGQMTVPPELIEQFMWFPLLEDQRLGGVVMKLIQEFMYISFIAYTFIKWIRKEPLTHVDPIHD